MFLICKRSAIMFIILVYIYIYQSATVEKTRIEMSRIGSNLFKRSFSSTKINSDDYPLPKSIKANIAFKAINLGLVCTGFYFFFTHKEQSSPSLVTHPSNPLLKFTGIPYSRVNELLTKHQKSFSVKERSSKNGSSQLTRYDTSTINSNTPSEDRHTEHMYNGKFIFGVYDGHSGGECVDIVSSHLPNYAFQSTKSSNSFAGIADGLKVAFNLLDTHLLSGSFDPVLEMGATAFDKLMKSFEPALSGSCALIALIDDDTVHIAWTGDSRAVLGKRNQTSGKYERMTLSADHTTKNPHEYERLIESHPNELETVVVRGRVLGGLMPTRAFGDARYKYTVDQQSKILPYFGKRGPPKNYKSPPYVIAEPEVFQVSRKELGDFFIVMATDGLFDAMEDDDVVSLVAGMINGTSVSSPLVIQSLSFTKDNAITEKGDNFATHLIRNALAGDSGTQRTQDNVQRMLGIPSDVCRKYRDDMTVTVLCFDDKLKVNSSLGPETLELKPIKGVDQLPLLDLYFKDKL